MREVQTITQVFKFSELSETAKENAKMNIVPFDCVLEERIDTLKKVADVLGGRLDYSLSALGCRSDYLRIESDYELDFDSFWQVINQEKDCPFTGVCYDHDIIDHFTKYNLGEDTLKIALNDYIQSIYKECWSMIEDDSYMNELCDANDYEFTANGELY